MNWILAYVLSFRHEVVYWKKSGLNNFFMMRFQQIYRDGTFTQGDWVNVTAPIFFDLKEKLPLNKYEKRIFISYKGIYVDFTDSAMQRAFMSYESITHFFHLIRYWEMRQVGKVDYEVVNFIDYIKLEKIGLPPTCLREGRVMRWNIFIDCTWFFFLLLFRWLASCYSFLTAVRFRNEHEVSKTANIKIVWDAISFNEIAREGGSYDITALIQRKLLNSSENLYIFPVIPDARQRDWLRANSINWTTKKGLFSVLRTRDLLEDLGWLLQLQLNPLFVKGARAYTYFINLPLSIDLLTAELIHSKNISTYIASIGNGAQESPIVSILNAIGTNTIWWSYAGVGTKHIPHPMPFEYHNEQVEESVFVSKKKLVWSPLDKLMLEKRRLSPKNEHDGEIYVVGPIMSGNSGLLDKKPGEVRKMQGVFNPGIKLWISVFDIPTFSPYMHTEHRWPVGSLTKEMQSAFFSDLIWLAEIYQEIGFIIKPKRNPLSESNKKYIVETEVRYLCDNDNFLFKEKRLSILSNNIDPYIPVAACDAAIAMPYTSALQAVLACGKPGIYYEATDYIQNTYPEEINAITYGKREDLKKAVGQWLSGSVEVNRQLFGLMHVEGDPGQNLVSHINGD